MKTNDAVEAIRAKLKELDAQNAPVLQAYESYQADRKAVQRTLELLLQDVHEVASPSPSAPPVPPAVPMPAQEGHGDTSGQVQYGGLVHAVREFAKNTTGKFSTKDAKRFLKNHHPELHAKLKSGALSGTFYKLRESGAIKLVDQGSGRKPSTYVKP
jgi:hypothetical protein